MKKTMMKTVKLSVFSGAIALGMLAAAQVGFAANDTQSKLGIGLGLNTAAEIASNSTSNRGGLLGNGILGIDLGVNADATFNLDSQSSYRSDRDDEGSGRSGSSEGSLEIGLGLDTNVDASSIQSYRSDRDGEQNAYSSSSESSTDVGLGLNAEAAVESAASSERDHADNYDSSSRYSGKESHNSFMSTIHAALDLKIDFNYHDRNQGHIFKS